MVGKSMYASTAVPENYKPIDVLSIFSKVFERSMFAQMSNFLDNFFSK